jgi:hypothetical protein
MRRVTIAQIEAFCCIMRYGSFRAAASHLNLTQPTLSIRIRGMEDVLGFQLFKKVGRGSQPTMNAEAILPQAERLLVMAEDFTTRPKPTDALRGSLRLGAPDCFGTSACPTFSGNCARFPTFARPSRRPGAHGCKALNTREPMSRITEPKTGPTSGSSRSAVRTIAGCQAGPAASKPRD